MNRGKPLKRRARLVARAPLARGAELKRGAAPTRRARMAAGRSAPAVPAPVRKALRERSGGFCEMRLEGGLGRATDPCHRIASGNGGRQGAAKVHHDRLSNVVHGCRACHDWCHDNIASAELLGLMLREGDVPEAIPVLLPGHSSVPLLLDNAGGFESIREVA